MKFKLLIVISFWSLDLAAQDAGQLLDSAARLQYKAKNYAAAAATYAMAFRLKQPYTTYYYYLQAVKCAAKSGQTGYAFDYLQQVAKLGYINTAELKADTDLISLHGSGWDIFINKLQHAEAAYMKSINPDNYGLNRNVALEKFYRMAGKLSAMQLYEKLSHWNTYPAIKQHVAKDLFLRFTIKINDTLQRPVEVFVPKGYRADRPTAMIVYLPGGWWMRTKYPPAENREILFENPTLPYVEKGQLIEVFPMVDHQVAMFRQEGYQNINAIVQQMKNCFNIDDNRVFMAGFSDGGSSTYNLAGMMPTDFAAFYPINGWLSNASHFVNLANRLVHGYSAENDMYNHQTMLDKMNFANRLGASWTLKTIACEGHFYYPYAGKILPDLFSDLHNRKRIRFPETISWEVNDPQMNRCDWLSVTTDTTKHNVALQRTDTLKTKDMDGEKPVTLVYMNKGSRVYTRYHDNHFELNTDKTGRITLFIHPAMVNLSRPVIVTINGQRVFNGKVKMDKNFMLTEFRAHPDRSRVYVNSLSIDVP